MPPLSDTRREALEDYVGSEDRIFVAGDVPEEYGKWETAYRRYELWLKPRL